MYRYVQYVSVLHMYKVTREQTYVRTKQVGWVSAMYIRPYNGGAVGAEYILIFIFSPIV